MFYFPTDNKAIGVTSRVMVINLRGSFKVMAEKNRIRIDFETIFRPRSTHVHLFVSYSLLVNSFNRLEIWNTMCSYNIIDIQM